MLFLPLLLKIKISRKEHSKIHQNLKHQTKSIKNTEKKPESISCQLWKTNKSKDKMKWKEIPNKRIPIKQNWYVWCVVESLRYRTNHKFLCSRFKVGIEKWEVFKREWEISVVEPLPFVFHSKRYMKNSQKLHKRKRLVVALITFAVLPQKYLPATHNQQKQDKQQWKSHQFTVAFLQQSLFNCPLLKRFFNEFFFWNGRSPITSFALSFPSICQEIKMLLNIFWKTN